MICMKKTIFIENIKFQLLSTCPKANKLISYIAQAAENNSIDPEILYGILLLEIYNRGGIINSWLEKILLKCIPNYFTKMNPSLGVGQIKITTASSLLGKFDYIKISKLLINKRDNIYVCAKLLKKYSNQINNVPMYSNQWFLYISKLYLTGKINVPNYPWIEIYSELLQWSFNKNLFYNAKKSYFI